MMHVLQDGRQIQEAIRTMLLQLCRVGVIYENELSIVGTLGVTIDKKTVVLVHFDEQYSSVGCPSDRKQPSDSRPASDGRPPSDVTSLTPVGGETELRLLGAEALYSLQDYLSPPLADGPECQAAACGSLQQMTKEAVDSKLFQFTGVDDVIPIEDSDSESFAALPFDVDPDASEDADVKAKDVKNIVLGDGLSGGLDGGTDVVGDDAAMFLLADVGYGKIEASALDVSVDVEVGRVRTTDRRRACDVCGRVFAGVAALESHLVGTHGVTRTPSGGQIPHFDCAHCQRKFRFRCLLEKHARMHDAARPHRCRHCANAYRHRDSLTLHLRVHTGDVLACHLCNKGYATRKLFQKHIVYMHEIRRSSNS